eukprot:5838441-Amphidinium_carterae.1
MDTCIMRFLLSWHASHCIKTKGNPTHDDPRNADSNPQVLTSLDHTGAFLNAKLPERRAIVLKPPNIFVTLGVVLPNTYWLLHRALYGLRELPMLWGVTRDKAFTNVRIPFEGEIYQLLQT